MFASAFAAIAAFQVKFLRENLVALRVIIKVFIFFDVVIRHKLNPNQKILIFLLHDNCVPKASQKYENKWDHALSFYFAQKKAFQRR